MFQLVVDLEKQASELETDGAKSESVRSYVQTEANLNDVDALKLSAIATACVERISQQDAKAIEVIKKFQAQFPGGRISKGVKMPPPPPELKVLQQERDQIILAAKSELDTALGTTASQKIERFASGFTNVRSTLIDK